jgi:hypothetical protein
MVYFRPLKSVLCLCLYFIHSINGQDSFDINSVSSSTRGTFFPPFLPAPSILLQLPQLTHPSLHHPASWCTTQRQTCATLCTANVSAPSPIANTCDPDTLAYVCTSSSGTSPDLATYQGTIPTFECETSFQACVRSGSTAETCQQKYICGTTDAKQAVGVGGSGLAAATTTSAAATDTRSSGASTLAPVPSSSSSSNSSPPRKLSTATIAALAVTAAAVVILVTAGIVWIVFRRRKAAAREEKMAPYSNLEFIEPYNVPPRGVEAGGVGRYELSDLDARVVRIPKAV